MDSSTCDSSVAERKRFSITSLMSEALSYPFSDISVANGLTSQMEYYPTWTHAPAMYTSGLKGMEGKDVLFDKTEVQFV